MNRSIRTSLLAGASALAISLGFAAQPAKAFNEVNWTWNAHVWELVKKYVDIDIYLDPTGMVMLEDLQVHIGDVKAESVVYGVYNWQPQDGNSTTTVQVPVDLGEFTASGSFGLIPPSFAIQGDQSGGDFDLNVTPVSAGSTGGGHATFTGTWDLGSIVVEVEVPNGNGGPLDALTELPEVVSAATAVANNTSISADTAVQLHEGQFAVGDTDYVGISDVLALGVAGLIGAELAEDGVNSNLVGAAVLGTAALLGGIDTANIEATSSVAHILNATVDSSATAVANNLTVDVIATGDDRLVIGDVVQLAVADVKAKSYVGNVSISNYTNLGALDRPIVSSIATAVGNNKSITVGPIVP